MRRIDRQVTDKIETLAIIQKADSCRLAVIASDVEPPEPYIIPLNYGFNLVNEQIIGSNFYFHGAKVGRKLQFIQNQTMACLEIDTDHQLRSGPEACDWGMAYASVIAWGKLFGVEDEKERQSGLDCLMQHFGAPKQPLDYSKFSSHTMVFKLVVERWTAKRKK